MAQTTPSSILGVNSRPLGHQQRIALYFSGRIKTYEEQLSYLKQLKDTYNIDMFCSINGEKDEQHVQFMSDLQITDAFFEDHSTKYNENWAQTFRRLPTQSDRDAYKLSSSLYNNLKAMELIEKYQEAHSFVYDIVIKFRADIVTKDMLLIPETIHAGTVYIPSNYGWDFFDQPGINDHIAYGSFDVMKAYSSVFARVETYCTDHGRGYHPESLLLYHLQQERLIITRFPFEYTPNTNRHEPNEYG